MLELEGLATDWTLELAQDLRVLAPLQEANKRPSVSGASGAAASSGSYLRRGVDQLVLLQVLRLQEGGLAVAALQRLARRRRAVGSQERGRDDGVDVGDVLLQIGAGARAAEQLAAVRTSGRFWRRQAGGQTSQRASQRTSQGAGRRAQSQVQSAGAGGISISRRSDVCSGQE